MSEIKKKNEILYLSFNKDKSCLSVGMQKGYRIYDLTKKDSLFFYERILGKGIGIIEMLEKSNILGLVGGGSEAFEIPSKLNIYDDKEGKNIALLTFKSDVLNLRLKKNVILVICDHFIYLIDTINFKSVDAIALGYEKQKHIVFAFTLERNINKLAYNDTNEEKNELWINSYGKDNNKDSFKLTTNYTNNNNISCMEFDKEGKLLAVGAKNYNYLILYSTDDGMLICKCNIDHKSVNSIFISFEENNDFLCLSLDVGEIIIFNIKSANERLNELINNRKETEEEIWSRLYLPEKKAICAFTGYEIGSDHIICIGTKGNYYLVKYDTIQKNNLAVKINEKYILKNGN